MKKAKFFDNFGLKILAVFIAIILWLVVLNVSDPVRTNTYNDIPIKVVNAESITSQGKVYELADSDVVSVTVNAKRSILDSLDKDNFNAIVDLSRVNLETGIADVRIESNKYNESIESMKSKTETVTVKIEDMMRKQFFITPIVTGEPEDGYVIGDVTTAENIVRISGAESVVSSIKKVTAEVSVSGLSRSINTSVDLKLFDADGNQIKDFNLNKNISTVAVSAQIYETKEVPLVVNSYVGEPAEGYGVAGALSCDRDTVVIAGKAMNLNTVNVLEVAGTSLNVDGLTETTNIEVDLLKHLPEGIILADAEKDNMVVVTIPIEQMATKVFDFAKEAVQILNVPEGYEANVSGEFEVISIEMTGVLSEINEIQPTDISLVIDFEEYMQKQEQDTVREGTFRIPVIVSCAKAKTVVSAREYNLNINIVENKE